MKNREKVMAALLSSGTQTEAAEKCGITTRTLRTYLADPEFSEEFTRRKRQLITDATRQLQSSYPAAIKALREIVEGGSEGARISAARALLEYGTRFTEQHEVLTQLEELERAMTEKNGGIR